MALSIAVQGKDYIVAGLIICKSWGEAVKIVEAAEKLRKEERDAEKRG